MNAGMILLADDEASFRDATAELLRREGYDCRSVASVDEVVEALRDQPFDLLVADIRMPGNLGLRIVSESERLAPGMSIILVTGYPSVESAAHAVELPVLAYMTKPLEFEDLLRYIEIAMQSRPLHRIVSNLLVDLDKCSDELRVLLGDIGAKPGRLITGHRQTSAATLRRLAACVQELMRLSLTEPVAGNTLNLCEVVDCPQWPAHQAVFEHVIEVLREIKNRFKSKDLAELRQRLESHLGTRRE